MNLGSRSSIQYAQCPENQAFLTTWYTHMRIRVGDKLFCSENIVHIRNWWFLTELNTYIRHLHFISHQFIFSNDKFFKNCVSIRKTVLMFFKTFSDLQHFWFKFEKYAFLVFLDKYVPFYFLFFVSWNCFVQEFVSHCDLIITASLRLLFMDDSWVGHVNVFFNKAFVFRIKDRSLVIFSNYQPG